jgi:hypothetical protein
LEKSKKQILFLTLDGERCLCAQALYKRLVPRFTFENPAVVFSGDGKAEAGEGAPLLLLLQLTLQPSLTQEPQQAGRGVSAH